MAIAIHNACREKLIERLAVQLQHVRTKNSNFLDWSEATLIAECDKALPKGTAKDAVGEFPFRTFVCETLGREIAETQEYTADARETRLADVSGYEELNEVARRLVDSFCSLPWKYTLSYELTSAVGSILRRHKTRYDIADGIRLVCPDQKYNDMMPLKSGISYRDEWLFGGPKLGLLSGDLLPKHEWNKEGCYLQFDVEGFIGRYIRTEPVQEALSSVKAFFGLSMAFGFIKTRTESFFERRYGFGLENYLIVHKAENGKAQIWCTYDVPRGVESVATRLTYGREKDDAKDICGWIKACISPVFKNKESTAEIRRANEWLFDSHVGNNEVLSFIQSMVVMEILLGKGGDTTDVGITKLISNRCAYMIGDTRERRDEIKRDLEKIYMVRSNILHSGHNRLENGHLEMLYKLQRMCKMVIMKEVQLFVAERQSAGAI